MNCLWDFGIEKSDDWLEYNFEAKEKTGTRDKSLGTHWCVNNFVGTWRIPQRMTQDLKTSELRYQ